MAQETTLTPQQEILKAYLDERAKTDELFAKTYAKENKAFERCWQYVFQEAAKYAVNCPGGKAAAIMSEDVFAWAVHYYDEDDLEIDKPKPTPQPVAKTTTTPTAKTETKKPEKKATKATAKAAPSKDATSKAKTQERAGKRARKAKDEEEDLGLFAGFTF